MIWWLSLSVFNLLPTIILQHGWKSSTRHILRLCDLYRWSYGWTANSCDQLMQTGHLHFSIWFPKLLIYFQLLQTLSWVNKTENCTFLVWLLMITWYLLVSFSTGDDVQLFFFHSAEEIFKQSLEAMTTKGEWELIDLLAEKPVQLFLEGGWDNLIVYVGGILERGNSLRKNHNMLLWLFSIAPPLWSRHQQKKL